MKYPALTIEQKKYVLIPKAEYQALMQDFEDLKKVFSRKQETGKEANAFFSGLKKSKLKNEVV